MTRPKMRLEITKRITSLGEWQIQPDGSYRCGNVKVQREKRPDGRYQWFVYVFTRLHRGVGHWRKVMPEQRPWGYGHQGQAKIGAALMAKYQREEHQ